MPSKCLRLSLSLLIVASVLPARADICARQAPGVPGQWGIPPNWTPADTSGFGNQINDPRWNGAARFDQLTGLSPEGPTQVGMRVLRNGDILYFSFHSIADPNGATPATPVSGPSGITNVMDSVLIGLQSSNAALAPKLFIFGVNSSANGSAQTGASIQKRGWTWNGTSWIGPDTFAYDAQPALWVGTAAADGNPWGINLRLDTSTIDGAAFPGPYKFVAAAWTIAFTDSVQVHDVLSGWPSSSIFKSAHITDATQLAAAIQSPGASWGQLRYDTPTPCSGDISLDAMQIFTDNVPSSRVRQQPGLTNTFHVEPSWSGLPHPAGKIKAKYKLANWGAQIGVGSNQWQPALGWSDTLAEAGDPSRKDNTNDATGNIVVTCTNGNATRPCPAINLSTQNHDQCMFVQLEAVSGNSATFSRDSAYRNMDFENASLLNRAATISIAGLPARAGSTSRPVYLHVQTINLPREQRKPFELPRAAMQRARQTPPDYPQPPTDLAAPTPAAPPPAAAAPPAKLAEQPVLHQTGFERLAAIWPTYRVHAFYEAERWTDPAGVVRVRLESAVPFGYFIDHAGQLWGWDHELVDAEGAKLQRIGPDYYRIKVPEGGAVQVKTRVLAQEISGQTIAKICPHGHCPGEVTCACGHPGSARSVSWGIAVMLLAIGLGALLRLRRRWRA